MILSEVMFFVKCTIKNILHYNQASDEMRFEFLMVCHSVEMTLVG